MGYRGGRKGERTKKGIIASKVQYLCNSFRIQARPAHKGSSRWAWVGPFDTTVSVKGWMKSSPNRKSVLGSKHNLSLKGKMLSGGKVTLFGCPWGGQQLAEGSWQEVALVAPGQAGGDL